MKMYLASYVTVADFECLQEDKGYDCMADMAHPNPCSIGQYYNSVRRDAQNQIIKDLLEVEEIEDPEVVDFIDEETAQEGVTHIRVEAGTEVLGFIVIRTMETVP